MKYDQYLIISAVPTGTGTRNGGRRVLADDVAETVRQSVPVVRNARYHVRMGAHYATPPDLSEAAGAALGT